MTIEGREIKPQRKSRKHYRLAFRKNHTMVKIWIPNRYFERISKAKDLQRLSWWKCVLLGLGLRELRNGIVFPPSDS